MEQSVEQLVKIEPWRTNQGQPTSVLDPAWSAQEQAMCEGEPEFGLLEAKATGWWWCTKCGHCSKSAIVAHRTTKNPNDTLFEGLARFYQQRRDQGVPDDVTEAQVKFITGIALKQALATPPDQLGKFVDERLTVR